VASAAAATSLLSVLTSPANAARLPAYAMALKAYDCAFNGDEEPSVWELPYHPSIGDGPKAAFTGGVISVSVLVLVTAIAVCAVVVYQRGVDVALSQSGSPPLLSESPPTTAAEFFGPTALMPLALYMLVHTMAIQQAAGAACIVVVLLIIAVLARTAVHQLNDHAVYEFTAPGGGAAPSRER
jgi:hypothetical protein